MNAPHVSVIIICSVSLKMLDKLEKLDLFGLSENIRIHGIAFVKTPESRSRTPSSSPGLAVLLKSARKV